MRYILDGFLTAFLLLILIIGASYYARESFRGTEDITSIELPFGGQGYRINSLREWLRPSPTATPTPTIAPTATPTSTPIPLYTVQWGDNLSAIAKKFNVSLCALIEENNIQTSIIHAGMELKTNITASGGECGTIENPVPPSLPIVSNSGYIWPVQGGLSQYYWQGHAGIDITSSYGALIVSTAGGIVEWAGWSDAGCGIGVGVRHSDGSKAVYCHLSETQVTAGQEIAQGFVLGKIGLTGWTTGSHLHFELWVGGWPQNPLNYL